MSITARLIVSARSPFGRRVRLAAHRLEFPHRIELVDVFTPPPWLRSLNPMGQIPILEVQEGEALVDSPAILEHLHEWSRDQGGPGLWASEAVRRLRTRMASVMAAGVMTSTVSAFVESTRHVVPDDWTAEHLQNIQGCLRWLQDRPETLWDGAALTQPGWDTAVALEYLDLRLPLIGWRTQYLTLSRVVDVARRLPLFAETTPQS